MATNTANYNLIKPSETDKFNINHFNNNADLIDAALSKIANAEHTHDGRYYTEGEIDTKLAKKADTEHNHNGIYYTQSEIDTKLSGKANTSHTHDDRYYTESEVDTKLNGKANTSHTHDDRYYTEGEIDTKLSGKQNKLTAGTNITISDDATISAKDTTYGTATTTAEGLMSASDKSKLNGIETGANKITVDSALSPTSTNPVQNKVINDALSGKLSTSGTAAKATADASGNTITSTYATKSELSSGLSGKSDSGHNHDGRYYTESEVDTKLSGKQDKVTISTSDPSGGKHGDIWLKYE